MQNIQTRGIDKHIPVFSWPATRTARKKEVLYIFNVRKLHVKEQWRDVIQPLSTYNTCRHYSSNIL